MRTSFVVSAANGTYTSPQFNVDTLVNFKENFLTFEFYDDAECTEVSTDVTGTMTVNGKASTNSVWQPIPDGADMDMSDPLSLGWEGVITQFQIINTDLTNTNYVKLIYDFGRSV